MKSFIKCIAIALFILLCATSVSANDIEGTITYKDYIFILVHGVAADEGIFKGNTPYGNLKKYLEDNLALQGRVFCYTFNDPNGSNYDHAKELGNRKYHNPKPGMNGLCWLEKAREEFIVKFQQIQKREPLLSEIPSRYIILAHSMGNLGIRSYIYSDKVFGEGKGFYNDDIAKVIFIAPPLLGSDNVMATIALWTRAGYKVGASISKSIETINKSKGLTMADKAGDISSGPDGVLKISDFYYETDWDQIWNILMNPGENPFNAYLAGAIIAGWDIWGDSIFRMNGFGYQSLKPWWPGMVDLIPYDAPAALGYFPLTRILKDAELVDSTKEPSYSIVFGRGIPVCDWKLTSGMFGAKSLNDFFKQPVGLLNQSYGVLSLPLLGQFPTNQGKLLSFTLETIINAGFMTNDGDGLVPTYSARGEGIAHLKNANRYEHVFKTEHYEKYLSEQLPVEVAVTEAAIAAAAGFAALSGTSYIVAWRNLWPWRIPAALSLVSQTFGDIGGLQWDIEAHGHILEQYDLIKTAVLDTPAILTVNDLQAAVESGGSPEATALSFLASSVPPGYESIKVQTITENRQVAGTANMPVPMTLNNERKYVTSIALTKPPQRIAGKLNYLVPRLMKLFEYSFNFAAWKPIENVNPETGEFVLENLPFAEGQNIIAIRAENAVGIKSHQLLKVVLNTIPMLPSKFQPQANYYISDADPEISVEFNKSEYSGDYDSEKISIKSMELDGVTVGPQVESSMEAYHPWARASYKVPADARLSEGEHQVAVRAESNVGIAQGLWSFYVDRSPPTISMEALAAYSPRAPVTIRYTISDEVSPNLTSIHCGLYDLQDLGSNGV